MNHRIVSDMPGRIRVRSGNYAFTKEEALAIWARLDKLPYVESVKVSHLTGGILVCYEPGFRGQILQAVSQINLKQLEPVSKTGKEAALDIDLQFKQRLYRIVFNRLVERLLLPWPLRTLITLRRGLKFLSKGLNCLRQGRVAVEVLDGAAVGVSILQGNFNTASSIMFLLRLSELLEDYTRRKTRNALSQSLAIHVDTVWVEKDGQQVSIPVSQLQIGDKVAVRTGSMIPVDGKVYSGEASVNQASMTGEPLPVFKKPGDSVFAGTALEEGSILIEARALAGESRINRLVELIDQSESLKAGIQSKAERIADRIVPFSFLLALGVYGFTGNLRKALSVLLVDYSCAIKLATPISVISAMREAAAKRIMVKGGKYLEAIAEADTVVFDKTGTLTVASPVVSRVIPFAGYERDEVLRTAACLEEHFPHSVARAVVRKAQEEQLHHEEEHAEVEYIVAHGIATLYQGKKVVIGSFHFVAEDEKVEITPAQKNQADQEANGDSVIFLGINGKMAGFICVTDPPREKAAEAVAALKSAGIRQVVMLTGDGEATAKIVAERLGIDSYRSQVLPEDKAAIVKALKAEGHKVVMVGDGINDSPALAAADVSVAMKDSSDIAREVADITLLTSDLHSLVTIRKLSQKLMNRIKGNFQSIISVNTAILFLGLTGTITPNTSALLHNAFTMAISASSMRPCLREK
ncbi:MAG: heavy metal translocating P-type ATPase [Peptococcaceae bacterium]|jgi:heavy metal translocating P-type ATPase|nr:heavy metal translocating P-type ATPase [Peptococcaceae bacterium]